MSVWPNGPPGPNQCVSCAADCEMPSARLECSRCAAIRVLRAADLRTLEKELPATAMPAHWQRSTVADRGWSCHVTCAWAGDRYHVQGPYLALDDIERERGPRGRRLLEMACMMNIRQRLRRHLVGYPGELQTDPRVPGVLFAPALFR